jgi:hypothetical protein
MGGSWASAGDVASCFARYMFRRHFYQHCGFRLVRSLPRSNGLKPNPQIRLIADRVYLLGGSLPNNYVNLNPSKLILNYFQTMNKQYLIDSHLYPELFETELLSEYEERNSNRIHRLFDEIGRALKNNIVEKKLAIHLGASTGRISFELTKVFEEVN